MPAYDVSAALFAQGWTWESLPATDFTWQTWWANDRQLWVEPDIEPNRLPNPRDCLLIEPFRPVSSYFSTRSPPDPADLALHTTFCPGVGWGLRVEGVKVFQAKNSSQKDGGWCDIDKQTSLGDLVWPKPKVKWQRPNFSDWFSGRLQTDSEWQVVDSSVWILACTPEIVFDDAWNGGHHRLEPV